MRYLFIILFIFPSLLGAMTTNKRLKQTLMPQSTLKQLKLHLRNKTELCKLITAANSLAKSLKSRNTRRNKKKKLELLSAICPTIYSIVMQLPKSHLQQEWQESFKHYSISLLKTEIPQSELPKKIKKTKEVIALLDPKTQHREIEKQNKILRKYNQELLRHNTIQEAPILPNKFANNLEYRLAQFSHYYRLRSTYALESEKYNEITEILTYIQKDVAKEYLPIEIQNDFIQEKFDAVKSKLTQLMDLYEKNSEQYKKFAIARGITSRIQAVLSKKIGSPRTLEEKKLAFQAYIDAEDILQGKNIPAGLRRKSVMHYFQKGILVLDPEEFKLDDYSNRAKQLYEEIHMHQLGEAQKNDNLTAQQKEIEVLQHYYSPFKQDLEYIILKHGKPKINALIRKKAQKKALTQLKPYIRSEFQKGKFETVTSLLNRIINLYKKEDKGGDQFRILRLAHGITSRLQKVLSKKIGSPRSLEEKKLAFQAYVDAEDILNGQYLNARIYQSHRARFIKSMSLLDPEESKVNDYSEQADQLYGEIHLLQLKKAQKTDNLTAQQKEIEILKKYHFYEYHSEEEQTLEYVILKHGLQAITDEKEVFFNGSVTIDDQQEVNIDNKAGKGFMLV